MPIKNYVAETEELNVIIAKTRDITLVVETDDGLVSDTVELEVVYHDIRSTDGFVDPETGELHFSSVDVDGETVGNIFDLSSFKVQLMLGIEMFIIDSELGTCCDSDDLRRYATEAMEAVLKDLKEQNIIMFGD